MRGARIALVAALFVGGERLLAVDLLGANGAATAPTTSSCPTTLEAGQTCASGWFSIDTLEDVQIGIWNTTASETSTTVIEARDCPTCNVYTLKEVSDVAAGEVPWKLPGRGVGEIRVRVTAVGGGAVKGSLRAFRPGGVKVW